MISIQSFSFVICFFALGITFSYAQSAKVHAIEDVSTTRLQQSGIQTFDSRDRSIDGSTLLFNKWKSGIIELKNDEKISADFINLDLEAKVLVLYLNNNEYALPYDGFKSFNVKDIDMEAGEVIERRFVKLLLDKGETNVLEVITEGDFPLFKRYQAKIQKANYKPALDQGTLRDKVVTSTVYYLKYKDQLLELPNSRKKALKRFSNIKKLSNYLKDNKVDMKKELDLIALSNYLNLNTKK